MRKFLLLGTGIFALAACVPYPDPKPRFWGPKEAEFLAHTLEALLLLGLVVGLGVLAAWWLVGRGRQGRAGGTLGLPSRKEGLLASRLVALRQQASTLPAEKAERVMALVVEAWEAWGQGEVARAEALAARAEALVDLLREDA
ncbi:hypothetical protein [Meiothermus sp.]|uniref:hypothetical protein n=1 Tax=Meiothermus sp. TaxID=1955249 RepID=UPI0021DB848C|nr:hypothetical protein [Meiothermus sp.]GIW35207.1 MAG: hypothetical protein KatS3mg072_2540 [Meiothermus sp.]